MTPAVSLIIVSQRRPLDLERVIASLTYQSLKNFEVIVVADRPPLISKFLKIDVRYVEMNEANISKARNMGICEAAAPIVAFCDDDAVPDPFWLERIAMPFYLDEEIAACGGFIRGRNGISYQWKGVGFYKNSEDISLNMDTDAEVLIFGKHKDYYYKCIGTNCAYRRDVLHKIGGFDTGFYYYLEDADINKRLQDAGYKTAFVPKAEIIHNYRASRGRSPNRVPQSLYNLGASTHLFLRKHNPEALKENLEKLVADQHRRLFNFFHIGLIRSRQIGGLLRDLKVGIEAGGRRKSVHSLNPIDRLKLVKMDCEIPKLKFYRRRPMPPLTDEIPVQLIQWPTSHAARLVFRRAGYWRLRMGRFGRLERKGPIWRYRTKKKLRQEIEAFLKSRFGNLPKSS